MGVQITFTSGKTANFKNATGFKQGMETFKNLNGSTYQAMGYVIFFGKGKKAIHYKVSSVRSINQY